MGEELLEIPPRGPGNPSVFPGAGREHFLGEACSSGGNWKKNKGGFKFYDFKKIMRLPAIIYHIVIRDSQTNELLLGRLREIAKGTANIIIHVLCYLV